jgi:hypothetical protein
VRQFSGVEPGGFADVQITQFWILTKIPDVSADKRQPVTRAASRACEATQGLVVALRTLKVTVTDIRLVNTHGGPSTAVEARALVVLAVLFVLVVHAVKQPVAAREQGQTVAVRTLIMRVWTHHLALPHAGLLSGHRAPAAIKVQDSRGRRVVSLFQQFYVVVGD